MPRVTQADVVKATIEQIEKRGGFTTDNYFRSRTGMAFDPGPEVVATCAVGGVEQAIWRLTGEMPGHRLKSTHKPMRGSLFAGVMAKLNRKAKALYGDLAYEGDPIETLEEVTFVGSKGTARKRVLFVLRAVLDDLTKKERS